MTFEDFLNQRLASLLRYATVLTCDPVQAQDIVQDVLVRAQQRWSRIGRMELPAAYVKRMVTNEFLSWRRRRTDVAVPFATIDALSPPVSDPTIVIDQRAALLAGIARLPRKQRAAVVLRYYDGCTDEEIATELGCSTGTVRSHISRAVATLRAAIQTEQELHR
ncbi:MULTISPECIES: SigE family RNA polymerase sigma factor [Actinokineospora]|uniref:RNA polymerase sigma24 factor n=1 Tax=Actinokineospora fastidiosa TaxID=1816 RepID=A0A918GAH4_9PSEU|nr:MULTISPECIES: SigE family RNA polymerase sigma factor [Actinokineospora]UVS81684.1 RNA polymerase sigma-E factor [Actinokineospora sp. UTMC 2448]GGS25969.1 RNA polymerase sigma24 factor [Actinokineospora fastidiosa]